MSRRQSSKPRSPFSSKRLPPHFKTYWQRSQQPLQALIFLTPLIVAYEIGTRLYAQGPGGETYFIYARTLLMSFFGWFGVTGKYLPGLIVVAVLLSWHAFRKDPWEFVPKTYGLMYVESALYALPLFVLLLVLAPPETHPRMAAATAPAVGGPASWQAGMVFGIGAGIYEELLFRLIAIAAVHALLVDLLRLPHKVGAAGAIVLSAVAFALYHFPAWNNIQPDPFIQLTLAGLYLAGIYLVRGFGVAAGTHALYDVLVVLWAMRLQ